MAITLLRPPRMTDGKAAFVLAAISPWTWVYEDRFACARRRVIAAVAAGCPHSTPTECVFLSRYARHGWRVAWAPMCHALSITSSPSTLAPRYSALRSPLLHFDDTT